MQKERSFGDYKNEDEAWITLATGEYYPDILLDACRLYEPVLFEFGRLLKASHSSIFLFTSIMEMPNQWMRTQLCRVFKKYVSPQTPVEMLKRKNDATKICAQFGNAFRSVVEIFSYANSHEMPHIKIIYVNDGPELLLGSMWNDYAYIENQWKKRVKVVTLRMVPNRITLKWLRY